MLSLSGCPKPSPCEDAGEWLTEPAPVVPQAGDSFASTRPADGNRYTPGTFDFAGATVLDGFVPGVPRWVAAVPWGEDSLWVATLDDEPAHAFEFGDEVVDAALARFPRNAAAPPSLASVGGEAMLLDLGDRDSATLAPATPLTDGRFGWVRCPGELVVQDGADEVVSWELDVLPDARIAASGAVAAVFGSATQRFEREGLGDAVEGGSLDVFDAAGDPAPRARIDLEEAVFEELGPLLADLDGDGEVEILAPISGRGDGAVVAVFDLDGGPVAETEAAPGDAWRQLVAVAPFGDEGLEVASVRSPQQGGPVQFHRLVGDSLVLVAEGPAIASHLAGSRDLDRVVAIDTDGDGRPELVGPGVGGLRILQRQVAGVIEVGTLPLDGSLATNVFAGVDGAGRPIIGAGTADGRLRVWRGTTP